MNTPAQSRIGGTASPSIPDLINRGCLIAEHFGRKISINRVGRLAIQFKRRSPDGGGAMWFLFVCNDMQISERHRQQARERAQCNPEWANVIGYSDPVGEEACHEVMKERGY